MPLNHLNEAPRIQVNKREKKVIQERSLTVGAVLLIFSVLTIPYSIAGKQAVLYCEAGATVPLRDNFKNISQIRYRTIPVNANTSPSLSGYHIHSFTAQCHIVHGENTAQRSAVSSPGGDA